MTQRRDDGPSWWAALEAMNGKPIAPLSDEEEALLRRVTGWYLLRVTECGLSGPPDVVRNLLGCANEVYSYNLALDAMGHPDAKGHETKH